MSGKVYDSITDKNDPPTESQPLNVKYTPSSLQLKLQKQRDKMRKSPVGNGSSMVITNAPKKTSLMSVARLQIPKSSGYQKLDNSPLVELESDSEDEIFLSNKHAFTARQVNKQLSRQLAKDGFQLDEVSDDEDLDLIPPNEFREARHCACCNAFNISCSVM
ncbi:protein FAM219A-like isoform X1 [Clavelina lepadiformis]|uniref:protein FAM219A-like isoform X1 n=1 Tax=Clavelina lepadiformis TaxID=159417 RepID=UPI004041A4B2